MEMPKHSSVPLQDGLTAFTDAGKATRRAAVVWKKKELWQQHIIVAHPTDNLQTLELLAVCWAMANWHTVALNIVTDSLYVAGG